MMSQDHLQEPFLNMLRKERVHISIYLVNGIQLQGVIDSFDQHTILLDGAGGQKRAALQLIYKGSIGTIVPKDDVRLPLDGDGNLIK